MAQPQSSTARFQQLLAEGVVVCDGAMGTMLHAVGASLDRCLPELNLSRPELVRDIHLGYVEAGAAILETNTFGANRLTMGRFGLADEVELVNAAAVRLAQEARVAAPATLIAGSIGPAMAPAAGHGDAALQALLEQAALLAEAGIELFVLETFGDLGHLTALVEHLRVRTALPIIAQVTFTEEGQTLSGDSPAVVARQLADAGADVIGANCTLGPRGILPLVEALVDAASLPISAQPNAGPPRRVRGRVEYRPNADYFARATVNLVRHGARVVGGCCGTTPRHIEAMVRHLGEAPAVPADDERPPAPEAVASRRPLVASGSLAAKTLAGEFVIAAELSVPDADHLEGALEDAATLLTAGATTLVLPPVKHSPFSIGAASFAIALKERLDVEAVISVATYDNSVLGLEADLLGAHALGVRTVLCMTGAPQPLGDYPEVAQLFDVSATDLIEALSSLNAGTGRDGRRGLRATSFLVGAQLDPNAPELDGEAARARSDLAAGAQFLVTTPTFEFSALDELLEAVGRPRVPLLLGIAPLESYAQAEFLHFERPQVTVPEQVLERLRAAGGDPAKVGREVACELVATAAPGIAGVVIYRVPGADIGLLISDLQRLTSCDVPLAH